MGVGHRALWERQDFYLSDAWKLKILRSSYEESWGNGSFAPAGYSLSVRNSQQRRRAGGTRTLTWNQTPQRDELGSVRAWGPAEPDPSEMKWLLLIFSSSPSSVSLSWSNWRGLFWHLLQSGLNASLEIQEIQCQERGLCSALGSSGSPALVSTGSQWQEALLLHHSFHPWVDFIPKTCGSFLPHHFTLPLSTPPSQPF